jgi:hypothetical protein
MDSSNGYGCNSVTSSDEGVPTPTMTSTATFYADNTNQPASSVASQYCSGPIPSPEPTVLLVEIQKAAEDVAQVVGRFGPKMAAKLCYPHIMAELFNDPKQLRLSSLQYNDSFTCRSTKAFAKPVYLKGEAPLLRWLWEPLFELFARNSHGSTHEFTSAHNTDVTLPYTISIKLGHNKNGNGEKEIEMTAAYGGDFQERHIFTAPIKYFRFQKRDFGRTTVPLAIDKLPYKGDGNYNDMLDYLMPRPGSNWRSAMKVPEEAEELVVRAFADTCKASDDFLCVTDDQDSQCKNLLRRLPPVARTFIEKEGLVGKEGNSLSIRANGPPGPKD